MIVKLLCFSCNLFEYDVLQMPEGAEAEDGSSEEEGSEEEASESEEEEKQTPKPDVKKAVSANKCLIVLSVCSCVAYVEFNFLMQAKAPSTPQAAATGGKTLFMGNLSFTVEEADVYVYLIILC